MYLKHFSLQERPFTISPDPRFLFMSNRYREALTHLTYGVQEGGGFVLLTGEVGTGKTTVCRCLLQQLPDNTRLAFVLNPKLNSVELLATICDELKIDYPENCDSLKLLTDKLSEYLLTCYQQNLNVVVMIDEAQNLETEVLEQIRLLTNLETNQKKLLQIILVGQPELQEKLALRELRQLAQRITARYHLRPLNLKETIAYILHRVRIAGCHQVLFSRQSIERLHLKTGGIPRLVNTICDRALFAAASRNKERVDIKIMNQAIKEIMGENVNLEKDASQNWTWLKPGLISLLVIGLVGGAYWAGQKERPNDSVVKAKPTEVATQIPVNQVEGAQVKPELTAMNQEKTESLVDLLIADQRWDNNGNWSMQYLLKLWQIDYSPIRDGSGCEYAASYNLKCSEYRGHWQQLREYNRPAILKFSAGLQGTFWGTLKSIKGLEATVVFGERVTKVKLEQLSSLWTGDFILLWQAPNGFAGDIKMGDQGPVVTWLSKSLNDLNNRSDQPVSVFDLSLKEQLMAFQRRRSINSDGIAGMQTILKINADTLTGIPLLELIN